MEIRAFTPLLSTIKQEVRRIVVFPKSFVSICVATLLLIGMSGCGSRQAMKADGAAGDKKAQTVAPAPVKPAETKKQSTDQKSAKMAPVSVVLKDINFDFDKYLITPEAVEILRQNYKWFRANPDGRLRVEGNCDERGTIEYNMVLGQKRADAAKKFLIDLGADEKRIETVSYGKEKPLDPGHTEEAWAKNRRGHFVAVP